MEWNPLVKLALFGWLPISVVLFAIMPARRAVVVTYLGAWLLLPEAAVDVPGLPAYTKISAAGFGALLGICLFDMARLMSYRFKWYDLPMLLWCLIPFISSQLNNKGGYDALTEIYKTWVIWGLPYMIGRLYFNSAEGMFDLVIGIIVAALLYVPLCLYEVRMSPQLHRMVYGFIPTEFVHLMRGGGFKPTVFLHGGLVLSMFIGSAAVLTLVLWQSKTLPMLVGVRIWIWLVVLAVTLVLCKSWASLLFTVGGCGLFMMTKLAKTRLFLIAALLIVPIYLTARVQFRWEAVGLVDIAEQMINPSRAHSLNTRLANENAIVEKVMEQRPGFGFAGWGDYRIEDDRGRDRSIVDSRWIIALGETGLIGLVTLFTLFLLPLVRLARCVPPRRWSDPLLGPLIAAAIVLLIFMLDRLLNAHDNPIPLLMAGGLMAVPWKAVLTQRERMRREAAMTAIDALPWDRPVYHRRRPRHAAPQRPVTGQTPNPKPPARPSRPRTRRPGP